MHAPAPDAASDDEFLRALVKQSRQRTLHLRWTDRDGSARLTALSAPEAARLHALARAAGLSAENLLREAAHRPVSPKAAATAPRPSRPEASEA